MPFNQTGATISRGAAAARHPAHEARAEAETGRGWYAFVARAGLVAKGLSFAIVGILAVKLALGDGGSATSREGALQMLAQHWFGKALLVGLALGFAGYAIWRFVQAFAERAEKDDEKGKARMWGKRAGYVGRGVIYAALAVAAVKILIGSGGGQSQNGKAHKTTAVLLSWPGGTWIVGIAGAVIIGVALWNVYRGIARKFEDKWQSGRMSRAARKWGGRAGVAGHLARGVVFTLIGIFVIKAAVDYNPNAAIGLDGALQKLSQASYGPFLLGLTAAGLICYGLYCFVDARYRDVSTNGGAGSGGSPGGGQRLRRRSPRSFA
jgi:hypothetical protein